MMSGQLQEVAVGGDNASLPGKRIESVYFEWFMCGLCVGVHVTTQPFLLQFCSVVYLCGVYACVCVCVCEVFEQLGLSSKGVCCQVLGYHLGCRVVHSMPLYGLKENEFVGGVSGGEERPSRGRGQRPFRDRGSGRGSGFRIGKREFERRSGSDKR